MNSGPAARAMVAGKRRPFWRGYTSAGGPLFELAAPALLLAAAWWTLGLIRDRAHLFDDDHFGRTVVGTLFFAVVAAAGIAGIWSFTQSVRTVVLESPCPCCGSPRVRAFGVPSAREISPTACGACVAYLRARGLDVGEEWAEPVLNAVPYLVPPARYATATRRDERGRPVFTFPACCAMCCAPDAPYRRDIGDGKVRTDLGLVGEVASDLALREPSTDYNYTHRNAAAETKSPDAGALSRLRLPVCKEHTRSEEYASPLDYDSDGTLRFASYPYYRQFCALNQIS